MKRNTAVGLFTKPSNLLSKREAGMNFPQVRLRRLRKNDRMRRLVRETSLLVDDFIYPLFVRPGRGVKVPIASMPGQFQLSIDQVIEEVKETEGLGILGVVLFGIPERKDEMGSEAYSDDGIIQRAVRAIKEEFPDFLVITDVCLCGYTSHGHCGVVEGDQMAPSDMMDGRVGAIRKALDENGFSEIPILAYSAKFASSFYGPFREAAESTPQFGDRRSYQMDFANAREALREVRLDIQEGADVIMVKPALPYLDVISRVREEFDIPVAAYNVSGEYAMIKAAAQLGWIDGEGSMGRGR